MKNLLFLGVPILKRIRVCFYGKEYGKLSINFLCTLSYLGHHSYISLAPLKDKLETSTCVIFQIEQQQ